MMFSSGTWAAGALEVRTYGRTRMFVDESARIIVNFGRDELCFS